MNLPVFHVGLLSECDRMASLHPRFATALAFLKRPDLATLAPGRYPLDGDDVFATISEIDLKVFGTTQRVELHHAYIDIQAPLSGPETIGTLELKPEETAKIAIDPARDIAFFEAATNPVTLAPGDFMVIRPDAGAHAPGYTLAAPGKVRKLIIKIRAA